MRDCGNRRKPAYALLRWKPVWSTGLSPRFDLIDKGLFNLAETCWSWQEDKTKFLRAIGESFPHFFPQKERWKSEFFLVRQATFSSSFHNRKCKHEGPARRGPGELSEA
jgi:hypothetical protein